ncbi:MAG TPA: hypothetical protein VF753_16880 [Terriglobales bacterium]
MTTTNPFLAAFLESRGRRVRVVNGGHFLSDGRSIRRDIREFKEGAAVNVLEFSIALKNLIVKAKQKALEKKRREGVTLRWSKLYGSEPAPKY